MLGGLREPATMTTTSRILSLAAVLALSHDAAFALDEGQCAPSDIACQRDFLAKLTGFNPVETMAAYSAPPDGQKWAYSDCQHIPCRLAPATDAAAVKSFSGKENPSKADSSVPGGGRTHAGSPGFNDGATVMEALTYQEGRPSPSERDSNNRPVIYVRGQGSLGKDGDFTYTKHREMEERLKQYDPANPGEDFAAQGENPNADEGTPVTPQPTRVLSNSK